MNITQIKNAINQCNETIKQIDALWGSKTQILNLSKAKEAIDKDLMNLAEAINEYNQIEASMLRECVSQDRLNIGLLHRIDTIVDFLSKQYSEIKECSKIFISHSSKDKVIIPAFVDNILKLGIGFKSEEIFCTSIEEMGIKNGEDMRTHIQANIKGCDFAFLMISEEYKKSGICLNEMGAVWACDRKVKTFILPDVNFDSIGWLYDVKKASKINDEIALDSLHDDMTTYFSLPKKTAEWGRQRVAFLSKIKP